MGDIILVASIAEIRAKETGRIEAFSDGILRVRDNPASPLPQGP
jgi:hypothetical protein